MKQGQKRHGENATIMVDFFFLQIYDKSTGLPCLMMIFQKAVI